MKRSVSGVLAAVLGVGSLGVLPPSTAGAASGLYLSSVMSMTPQVIHYIDNHRYEPVLDGDLTVAANAPCNGDCSVTVGLYAPGATNAWRAYQSAGVSPGTTQQDLVLGFPITRSMNPKEGVHQAVVKLYDSDANLIEQVVVESLTIYKPLKYAPRLKVIRDRVLAGRTMAFQASTQMEYADGHQTQLAGARGNADIEWRTDKGRWKDLKGITLTPDHPSKRVKVQVFKGGRFRLTVKGSYDTASSASVRGRVWEQTNHVRFTRNSLSTGSVYRGRSVTLRGAVKVEYQNGNWYAPVPGTNYAVQFRREGSSRWGTLDVQNLPRDGSFSYRFKPKATGSVRFRVLGHVSDPRQITVKRPRFDRVWVKWPRSFYTGERVVFPSCAVSNTGTGLRGVELLLQWRSTRLDGWTLQDRASTRKGGCVALVDARANGGFYRVYAPKYGKGKTQLYA